jgi:hypothetical protein
MPADPTDKRTAVGRDPESSVRGKDVCALVADPRFSSAPGEASRDGVTAEKPVEAKAPTGSGSEGGAKVAPDEAVQHGRSNNDKGYQESPDDRRRATQDANAAENPALLHRARYSSPEADTSLTRPPGDRRR